MQEETESGKAPKPVSVGGLGSVPVAEQQNKYHGRTARTENLLSLDVNCSFFTCLFLTHSDRIFVAKLDFLRWPGADNVHLYPPHIRGSIIIIARMLRQRLVSCILLLAGGAILEALRRWKNKRIHTFL